MFAAIYNIYFAVDIRSAGEIFVRNSHRCPRSCQGSGQCGGKVKTDENLRAAFEGESKAYMRYQAYARIAEKEGNRTVARLFRALAEAELVHAQNHLALLGEVQNTEMNLTSALDGETYEFTQMYPGFIGQAEKDINSRAEAAFRGASAVEKVHASILSEAVRNFGRDREQSYYVCSVCGNTAASEAPSKCSICGGSKERFKLIA